jgi:hypothetical protein
MTLKLKIQINGLDKAIEDLKKMAEGDFAGQFMYPVFISSIESTLEMLDLTLALISMSAGDYVSEAIFSLEVFTDEGFQARIFEILEAWGQNPSLSERALSNREKAGVGDTPRNVITGEYVRCFGLGFSETMPMDIPIQWVRRL